jgi:hypothetical protein
MDKAVQTTDLKENSEQDARRLGYLRTGLLLAGSAIFGGIAVAFWNRRTLAKMQNRCQENSEKILSMEDDAIY